MTPVYLLRTQSDERLVALARDGSDRAFEAIVERYRKPLVRSARRVVGDSRAEDAVQQAFVAAWRALGRGDDVRELRPWLHRILHNTALNVLRNPGYDFAELRESLSLGDAPEDELERRAVVRETLSGLAALPERQREALLQTAVEGRSQEEVARTLEISEGAVRQLVHRARMSLRAAATAITPLPFVSWVATASTRSPVADRVSELVAGAGGAGAAATLAKTGAVLALAGGAIGAPAVIQHEHTRRVESRHAQSAAQTQTVAAVEHAPGSTHGRDDEPGAATHGRRGADDQGRGAHRHGHTPGGDRDGHRGASDAHARHEHQSETHDRAHHDAPEHHERADDRRGGSGPSGSSTPARSEPADDRGTSGSRGGGADDAPTTSAPAPQPIATTDDHSGSDSSSPSGGGTSGSGSGTSGSGTSGTSGGSGTSGSGSGSGSTDGTSGRDSTRDRVESGSLD